MNRRTAASSVTAAMLCAALATACGSGGGNGGGKESTPDRPAANRTAPTTSGSELQRLTQLVDKAETAARSSEKDAATDN
ncbi:hypothetical protein [Wenjunlia tyrosinilytica]|uniref:Uncharacterized protein n=1 Tax=Wenjunlia tyrosinilytica TaxID=1544741 RepID=A0A917ZMQ2_9ACTN|nr:hypothetical protein [Wenjunlia tyrosinilytica]GGO87427.1 hypothetical protein GCM10012280_25840 [Wenjunlia tyrosinilytica]